MLSQAHPNPTIDPARAAILIPEDGLVDATLNEAIDTLDILQTLLARRDHALGGGPQHGRAPPPPADGRADRAPRPEGAEALMRRLRLILPGPLRIRPVPPAAMLAVWLETGLLPDRLLTRYMRAAARRRSRAA